jgi:hypothetical protein
MRFVSSRNGLDGYLIFFKVPSRGAEIFRPLPIRYFLEKSDLFDVLVVRKLPLDFIEVL